MIKNAAPDGLIRQGEQYASVGQMLREQRPENPVYCIFPHVYRDSTKAFLEGFPGRVLYAVKANNDPRVLELLIESGVSQFSTHLVPPPQSPIHVLPAGASRMVTTGLRPGCR